MAETESVEIWKTHDFNGKYKSAPTPPGETIFSGMCLRQSLFKAGIFTDLPAWTRDADVPGICADLELPVVTGGQATIKVDHHYIVGYVVDQKQAKAVGHFEYVTQPEVRIKQLDPKDIFAIIEIPNH